MIVGEAFVAIRPDVKGFGAETEKAILGDVQQVGKKAGKAFGQDFVHTADQTTVKGARDVGKRAVNAFASAAVITEGISFFKTAIGEAREAESALRQTEAVLKSTGGVANVTAGDIDKLTGALQKKLAIDDDLIRADANLLLTFCLEESAQALTKDRGWVTHDQLAAGDEILGYDPDTDLIEWQPVDSVHRFQVNGDLIRWKSKQIDVATTPHHRWWTVGTSGYSPYTPKFMTTEEISGHQVYVKIGGGIPAAFAGEPTYSDDLVELAGWVATEGWLINPTNPRSRGIGLCQSDTANPAHTKRIRCLVDRLRLCGHKISESHYYARYNDSRIVQWHFAGDLGTTVRELLPNKKLTVGLLQRLTVGQAELLMDTLIAGDGHIDRHGHAQFIQKDPEQLAMVAMLAAMLGQRSTILDRGGNQDSIYFPTTNNLKGSSVHATPEHYEGVVWCPHLRTGIFMARNNGRTFWTGNTNVRNEAGKGNKIFDEAIAIFQDMKAALPSADIVQLGKALNDPVKGITALTRVGVTFTAQQKKQIEDMAAFGDIAGAQKIILAELAKEFGGSAEAQVTASKKLGVAMGELRESVGAALIPVLETLAKIITPIATGFASLPGPVQVAIVAFATFAAAGLAFAKSVELVSSALTTLKLLGPAVSGAISGISAAFTFLAANPIVLVVAAIAGLVALFIYAYKESETFRDVIAALGDTFQALGGWIYDAIVTVQQVIGGFIEWLRNHWQLVVAILTGPVGLAVSFIVSKFDEIVGFVKGLGGRITAAARGMWDGIKVAFRAAVNAIVDFWNSLEFKIPGFSAGPIKFGGFTLGVPDIPRMAQGGIVFPTPGGTIVNVAEAGKPEAVVPLPPGLVEGLSAIAANGGVAAPLVGEMTVVAPDPMTAADEIPRQLRAAMFRLGVS